MCIYVYNTTPYAMHRAPGEHRPRDDAGAPRLARQPVQRRRPSFPCLRRGSWHPGLLAAPTPRRRGRTLYPRGCDGAWMGRMEAAPAPRRQPRCQATMGTMGLGRLGPRSAALPAIPWLALHGGRTGNPRSRHALRRRQRRRRRRRRSLGSRALCTGAMRATPTSSSASSAWTASVSARR